MQSYQYLILLLIHTLSSTMVLSDTNTELYRNCIIKIDKISINLNELRTKEGYEVITKDKTFLLNICGNVPKCGISDVSACIIQNNSDPNPIGSINNLKILNHSRQYGLRYKYRKQETNIEFKCNRHLKSYKIHPPQNVQQGSKKFKFIFETPLVCVKQPTSCYMHDVENFYYDLTTLYNPISNWFVKNSTKTVILNICGDLHPNFKTKDNACAFSGTQVCLLDEMGNKNLGVFSSGLIKTQNGLIMNITDGSLCQNSMSMYTFINFICAFNDSGPILSYFSECEYNIVWYTPTACPFHYSINNNCKLDNDLLDKHDIIIHSSKNEEYSLSETKKIKFNICGVINGSCNGEKDVSFCLIEENKQTILGYLNETIITKDTNVTMQLTGEKCPNKNIYQMVNIQFICDYIETDQFELTINEDKCVTLAKIRTNKVCRNFNPSPTCKTKLNDINDYDVSALKLNSSHFEVVDPDDPNLVYLINVCLPVFSSDAICPWNSAVCLQKNSEPNKYERFLSLGNFDNSTGLMKKDDKLIIKYETTTICPFQSELHYRTIIEFQCENNVYSNITLVKNECVYKFIWKTKYACPIKLKQVENIETTKSNSTINVKVKNEETNSIKKDNKENDKKVTKEITASTVSTKEEKTVDKYINETTINEKQVNENPKMIQNTNSCALNDTNWVTSLNVPIELPKISGIYIDNCYLTNKSNEKDLFNLRLLPNMINITSKSGKIISVNVCQKEIDPNCAVNLTDLNISPTKKYIELNFNGSEKCGDGQFKSIVFIKCSENIQNFTILREDECNIELEWNNSPVCALFHSNKNKPFNNIQPEVTNATVPIVIGVFIAVILVVGVIIYRKRKPQINQNYQSQQQLLMCEFKRVKDESKIV